MVSCGPAEAPRSLDLRVKVHSALDVVLQDWDPLEMQSEALREEALDAADVAGEVELGVEVGRGHHLRKVDHGDLFVLANHQVELVEVAMDEAVLRKLDN